MTTIEDKIKLFSKIVNEKIQEEKQAELNEFDSQKNGIVQSKMQELEEKRKIVLQEASKKIQLKCNELVSRAKLEKQSEVLELKKTFINELTDKVREKLTWFVNSNEYEEFLVGLVKKTLGSIENGNYTVFITPEDMKKYKNPLELELKNFEGSCFSLESTEEDIIGGIIIRSVTGKFRINACLASKLEECNEMIGVKISEKIG